MLALYPDDPARHAVGSQFLPLFMASLAVLTLYMWRQAVGQDPLIPAGLLRSRVFVGANLTNLLVGAGLMVALVDVPIVARGVFGLSELDGALLLARFMVAIPVGALLGGWLGGRMGYRLTATLGLLVAALGFFRMAGWSLDELSRQILGVPDSLITLALCGFGFGLVIAPVAAAILDRSREREHGLASSLVVLARTVGMLLGLSGLAAFGIHRFYELFQAGPGLTRGGISRRPAGALCRRAAAGIPRDLHHRGRGLRGGGAGGAAHPAGWWPARDGTPRSR